LKKAKQILGKVGTRQRVESIYPNENKLELRRPQKAITD